MKKLTFGKVSSGYFVAVIVLGLINMFTLKSSVVHSFILSLLGTVLLIWPVYSNSLENKYDKSRCKVFIRAIAIVEIIISFCIHTNF